MKKEVVVVGYQTYSFAKCLVVGEIEFLDFEFDLSRVDCLIFTSKNAIKALAYNAQKKAHMQKWTSIPSYAIGQGSAKVLQDLGGRVEYISPSSHGVEFANELSEKLEGKNCLYLRAQEIVSNLDQKLQESAIHLTSIIAYKSKCVSFLSKENAPKNHSILLFTSPSAYRFFCNLFEWKDTYVAAALGRTTLNVFDQNVQKILSPFQDIQKSVTFLESQ